MEKYSYKIDNEEKIIFPYSEKLNRRCRVRHSSVTITITDNKNQKSFPFKITKHLNVNDPRDSKQKTLLFFIKEMKRWFGETQAQDIVTSALRQL